jgi:pilus assembly protein Flp/PilA
MEKMWMLLRKFMKEEEGMETVEYAVVGALVVIVGVAVWMLLGNNVSLRISQLASSVGGT